MNFGKSLTISLSLLLILSAYCIVITAYYDDEVVELTDRNFQLAVKSYRYLVVNFYDSNCKFCRALNPVYGIAAHKLKELGSGVKLGKIDGLVQKSVASKFNVKGYPTLIFFKTGFPIELYGGSRKTTDIFGWLLSKATDY